MANLKPGSEGTHDMAFDPSCGGGEANQLVWIDEARQLTDEEERLIREITKSAEKLNTNGIWIRKPLNPTSSNSKDR